jgi:hypothetical protein
MSRSPESMTEALQRFQARGFTHELRADRGLLREVATGQLHEPEQLGIAELVRFEGSSDPDEMAILFALEIQPGRPLGTYSTVYGPGTPPEDAEIVRRLGQRRAPHRTTSP